MAGPTRLTLEHAVVKDEAGEAHWRQFGPGATGIGWDLSFLGMALHLDSGGAAIDRAANDDGFGCRQGAHARLRRRLGCPPHRNGRGTGRCPRDGGADGGGVHGPVVRTFAILGDRMPGRFFVERAECWGPTSSARSQPTGAKGDRRR